MVGRKRKLIGDDMVCYPAVVSLVFEIQCRKELVFPN